jgi:hypothetical protein
MQQAKSTCKRKGLFQDYDNAIEAESEAVEEAKNFQEASANINTIGPKHKKDAKDPDQPSKDDLKASLRDAFKNRRRPKRPRPWLLKVSSCFMQTFSAQMPDSTGTRLSPVKSEQPRRLTFKGMNTRKSMARICSPFRIASPSISLTCSPAMQPNSSASTSATY